MTERDWICSADPQAMLSFLRGAGKLSDRKARLFAVACCRRIWPLLTDERSRKAVEVAERYADGTASDEELQNAGIAAGAADEIYPTRPAAYDDDAYNSAAYAAYEVTHPDTATSTFCIDTAANAAASAVAEPWTPSWEGARSEEERCQCRLLRDVVGLFYPWSAVNLPCRMTIVLTLAQVAYDDRQLPSGILKSDRLAVLADAGCTDALLLEHLRVAGPHVRGCWALDLVLGRA